MPSIKRTSSLLTFMAAISLLCGCAQNSSAPTDKSRALEQITIAQYGHIFLYLPIYVAVDKGFFRDQGLDVKIVSTGGDEKTFAAVSSGNAQFGVADPTFAAIARERGMGGKVVAAVVRGVPFWLVTTKPSMKPLSNVSELSGLRIATYPAPSTSYAVMKHTLQNNGKPISAKITQASFGTLLSLLKADQADVAEEIEPVVSIATAQGAKVVYSPCANFGDFAFTGVTVTDSYCQTHKDTIQKFVNALAQAMNFIQSHPEETAAIASREFPENVTPEIAKSALARLEKEHTIPTDPVLPKAAWDNAISLRREIGDLNSAGSFDDNVDNSFAQKATGTAK